MNVMNVNNVMNDIGWEIKVMSFLTIRVFVSVEKDISFGSGWGGVGGWASQRMKSYQNGYNS